MGPTDAAWQHLISALHGSGRKAALAITGGGNFAAGDVLRIAELLGADNSLKKPFEPAALLATVRRCLAQ